MNLATTKIELARQLLETENTALIKHIKALFETQDNDLWNELHDDVKKLVERGIAQADKGVLKPHAGVMAKYKKWLKK